MKPINIVIALAMMAVATPLRAEHQNSLQPDQQPGGSAVPNQGQARLPKTINVPASGASAAVQPAVSGSASAPEALSAAEGAGSTAVAANSGGPSASPSKPVVYTSLQNSDSGVRARITPVPGEENTFWLEVNGNRKKVTGVPADQTQELVARARHMSQNGLKFEDAMGKNAVAVKSPDAPRGLAGAARATGAAIGQAALSTARIQAFAVNELLSFFGVMPDRNTYYYPTSLATQEQQRSGGNPMIEQALFMPNPDGSFTLWGGGGGGMEAEAPI